jgi:tRNA(fMet)-specific endonuclease VapC
VAHDQGERAARQAHLPQAGRKTTARTYDAMIAATAVANDLPIYTCSPADFSGTDELDLVAIVIPEAG